VISVVLIVVVLVVVIPIGVLISGADRRAYVYRNGVEIGHANLHIDNPEVPLAE